MRVQLRPFYSDAEQSALYGQVYDHAAWPAHVERVAETTLILDEFAAAVGARTVADLSCGDGAIVRQSRHPWQHVTLGDYATTGVPIEKALHGLDPVDMFVCSETIEHLRDPDAVLALIGTRARWLVLSTPVGEVGDDNLEHYWGWDVAGVGGMLAAAGWGSTSVRLFTPVANGHYTFQIWTCGRDVTR